MRSFSEINKTTDKNVGNQGQRRPVFDTARQSAKIQNAEQRRLQSMRENADKSTSTSINQTAESLRVLESRYGRTAPGSEIRLSGGGLIGGMDSGESSKKRGKKTHDDGQSSNQSDKREFTVDTVTSAIKDKTLSDAEASRTARREEMKTNPTMLGHSRNPYAQSEQIYGYEQRLATTRSNDFLYSRSERDNPHSGETTAFRYSRENAKDREVSTETLENARNKAQQRYEETKKTRYPWE
jgi:hypothetical protein